MKRWWQVLGIPRDSDRAAIRRAYAARLKTTHPEDDAAGFMALRTAYEAALAWVDRAQFDDWDAAEEPTMEAAPAPDVVDVAEPPAPDPVAAPPPDPLAEQRAAELADLERRFAHLAAGLHGPWFQDGDALRAAFDAVMAAPALIEIDLRARTEYQLAALIADTIPRSDAILRQAMEAFGWEGEGNHPPAVWQLRARFDEWRLIAMLGGDHPLAAGWRALTDGGARGWQRRVAALRPGLADQVAQLLMLADREAPGIAHSFHPHAADWWRAHLDAPRFGWGELGLMLLGAVAAAAFALAGATPALRVAGALAGIAVGIGLALLHGRVIVPRHWRLRYRPVAPGSGWRIGAWLAVSALAVAAPPVAWLAGAVGAAALGLGVLILWRDGDPGLAPMGWGRVAQLVFMAFFVGPAFALMQPGAQLLFAGCAMGAALVGLFARGAVARLIAPAPLPIALSIAMALVIGAIVRSDFGPAGSPLVPWGVAAATGLVAMAGLRAADPAGRGGAVATVAGVVLWAVILIAAAVAVPGRPRDGAALPPPVRVVPTGSMQRLEMEQPEFATMRTGNPELHGAVANVLAEMDAGRRDIAATNTAIDDLVQRAYRERLPRASAPLVVGEMNLRLQLLREAQTADPAGCAKGTVDFSRISKPLGDRISQQRLRIAAAPPATDAELATGRVIPESELVRPVKSMADAVLPELERRLGRERAAEVASALRRDNPTDKCRAKIAYFEALMAHDDFDIARTVRASLAATPDAGQAKK